MVCKKQCLTQHIQIVSVLVYIADVIHFKLDPVILTTFGNFHFYMFHAPNMCQLCPTHSYITFLCGLPQELLTCTSPTGGRSPPPRAGGLSPRWWRPVPADRWFVPLVPGFGGVCSSPNISISFNRSAHSAGPIDLRCCLFKRGREEGWRDPLPPP